MSAPDKQIASIKRLTFAAVVSFILYPIFILVMFQLTSGIWEATSGKPVSAPEIGVMSNYSKPAQNGYFLFVWLSGLFVLIFSVFSPKMLGSTIGQKILGITLEQENGSIISWYQCIKRSIVIIGLFLLIALPGPLVGFIAPNRWHKLSYIIDFGFPTWDIISLSLLAIGIFLILYLQCRKDKTGRNFLNRICNIYPTISKRH